MVTSKDGRQTDRQTDKERWLVCSILELVASTEAYFYGQLDRDRQTDRQRKRDRQIDRQRDRQTDRQKEVNTQTDRETDKQRDRKKE